MAQSEMFAHFLGAQAFSKKEKKGKVRLPDWFHRNTVLFRVFILGGYVE